MIQRSGATFSTPSREVLVAALLRGGNLEGVTPAEFAIDLSSGAASADWLAIGFGRMTRRFQAKWSDGRVISVTRNGVGVSGWVEPNAGAVLAWVSELPCTLVAFGPGYREWKTPELKPHAFSGEHALLGWGCAFKGAGHDDLVSRRWLDDGPWRLVRGPEDTSLVQFHDLEADWKTALAQATPGHARLMQGFLRLPYTFSADVRGLYEAKERLLKVVVAGREVPRAEMRDACAARRARASDAQAPLRNVAFIFVDEEAARAHLHELWLHGLECRAIVRGVEIRLDESYRPAPPVRPTWATT